ncbi:MAG: bifunctional demethylmenaquinone methyltransferase/2-methoxy-6-polyprenyl-1,4-benzoquinol methylase UbiE [Pseudomonadota bacterium]
MTQKELAGKDKGASPSDTTHFGYRSVATEDKASLVKGVFDSVADKYDVMNDLMSMGIHRFWKRYTLNLTNLKPGMAALDVAGGTGDLAAGMARQVGEKGRVVLTDINAAMLDKGRERLDDAGIVGNVEFALADAQDLPFDDRSFDCVTIAFGLRNVTDKPRALRSMRRVLKPGGQLLILEFSHPASKPLKTAYDAYSFNVLPRLGELVAGDADSYRYLAESIRMHPDQETLVQMMEAAGFERCRYYNLTGGIVALHRGYKL